jgi:hypothetical protein
LFSLGQFFDIGIWKTFFHGKSDALILSRSDFGCILGDFSPQTHLVTLEMGSSGSGR